MALYYTHAQSFFADPSLASGAGTIFLSSVEVYCKSRPSPINNISGIPFPGLDMYIVAMANSLPMMTAVPNEQTARCEYAQIMPSIDASLATTFHFSSPVPLATGQLYAFVIAADGNEEFAFWTVSVGQTNLQTNATISSISFNGSYYQLTVGCFHLVSYRGNGTDIQY